MLAPSNAVADVLEVNSTALPPGRICGQRCVASPCASCVTGVGAPPAAGIRDRTPPMLESAAMMLPSSPQLPPSAVARVAQGDCRAAFHRNLLQLSCREESDPLPVRREERSICPLRSRQLSGVGLIEPPGKESSLRHVHQPRAVRRKDRVGSPRGAKRYVGAEVNVQPHQWSLDRPRRPPQPHDVTTSDDCQSLRPPRRRLTATCSWKLEQPALHRNLSVPQSHLQSRSESSPHPGFADACLSAGSVAAEREWTEKCSRAARRMRVPSLPPQPECPRHLRREMRASLSATRTAPRRMPKCRCALSTALPLACSGLMYAAVPRITPCIVAAMLSVGELPMSSVDVSPANAFAKPKSNTLTFPSGVSFTLAGFRSR